MTPPSAGTRQILPWYEKTTTRPLGERRGWAVPMARRDGAWGCSGPAAAGGCVTRERDRNATTPTNMQAKSLTLRRGAAMGVHSIMRAGDGTYQPFWNHWLFPLMYVP